MPIFRRPQPTRDWRHMRRHLQNRPSPSLLVARFALFVALGGSVYAAGKIDSRPSRVKALRGKRLPPGSVPADRLRPGALGGLAGAVTGGQVDERSLAQVPSADPADSAGFAQLAGEAETA